GKPCACIGLRASDVFGAVDRSCQVEVLVPHRVSTHSRHILGQTSIDKCPRRRSGSYVAPYEGKSPGRRAVPEILDTRIVVQSDSECKRSSKQLACLIGIADICIVPTEVVTLGRVSDLYEAPYMAGPRAGEEQR